MRVTSALLCASLCACATVPPSVAPAPLAQQADAATPAMVDLAPPSFRLGDDVVPTAQSVTLNVDPDRDGFTGESSLTVQVNRPRRVIWLHAKGLTVTRATLRTGGETMTATVMMPTAPEGRVGDFLGLVVPRVVAPGPATLEIAWSGKVSFTNDRGVFVEKEGEVRYVFSQFESTDARRAFPCFDEPRFKLPWQLTLNVPSDDGAYSNTPVETETVSGATRTLTFKRTRPLPSYLVAFGVGPFAVVPAGVAGVGKTPLRVLVPTGHEAEAKWAVARTGEALTALEKWFGTPYPFEKLDVMVIPQVSSYGAMENPGLITIGSRWALASPARQTLTFQRTYLDFMTHELAHMWFGDLVTTAWWDDIWLNEAFASWMGNKVNQQLEPTYGFDADLVDEIQGAMDADGLLSSRKVRQEILSNDDIVNAFDDITYSKGEGVIASFERFVGPEAFQRGVRAYLAAHTDGVATAPDFLSDVSRASGTDVSAAFSTFLDQPGVPRVEATPSCKNGRLVLSLTQSRHLPLGTRGEEHPTLWKIPLCVRAGAERTCLMLETRTAELTVAQSCNATVALNEGGIGYYHVVWSKDALQTALARGSGLSLPERLALVADVQAQVSSGSLNLRDALELVPTLAASTDPALLRHAAALVAAVPEEFVPPNRREVFQRFVVQQFGQQAKILGFRDDGQDRPAQRRLRSSLVALVGTRGGDPATVKQALGIFTAALAAKPGLSPDEVELGLKVAGPHLSPEQFAALLMRVKTEKDAQLRAMELRVLTSTRDPARAVQVFGLVLDEALDAREFARAAFGHPFTRQARFDFLKQHLDTVVKRFPVESQAYLVGVGDFCDQAGLAELKALWTPVAPRLPGGSRAFQQVVEATELCIAQRKVDEPALASFLDGLARDP